MRGGVRMKWPRGYLQPPVRPRIFITNTRFLKNAFQGSKLKTLENGAEIQSRHTKKFKTEGNNILNSSRDLKRIESPTFYTEISF